MLNKVYNIVIYAHLARRCMSDYILGQTYPSTSNLSASINIAEANISKWKEDHNCIPNHTKEYCEEKLNRYLGDFEFKDIDHNILIDKTNVSDISTLVDYFTPMMDRISSNQNLIPKVTDSIIMNWMVTPFTVIGADHWLTKEIEEYLEDIGENGIKELIRDLKIKFIQQ